jgi:hypothetical protein
VSTPTPLRRPEAPGSDGGNGRAAVRLRRPRRVRVPQATLAALLIFTFALAGAVLYSKADDKQAVLAVARPVAAGDRISAGDLKVVRVSTEGALASVPASERTAIVGQVAATNLVSGSLLARAQLAGAGRVSAGEAIVGMALKPGQFPSHLGPGDRVNVVQGAGGLATDDAGVGEVLVAAATVVTVEDVEDSSTTVVVSLRLPERAAARVAALASVGRATLVLVAGEP